MMTETEPKAATRGTADGACCGTSTALSVSTAPPVGRLDASAAAQQTQAVTMDEEYLHGCYTVESSGRACSAQAQRAEPNSNSN